MAQKSGAEGCSFATQEVSAFHTVNARGPIFRRVSPPQPRTDPDLPATGWLQHAEKAQRHMATCTLSTTMRPLQSLRIEELPRSHQEAFPGGLVLKQDVIAALQGHEAGAWNLGGQDATLLEWHHGVLAAVKHEGGNPDLRQQRPDVQLPEHLVQAERVLGRR